MRKEQRAKRMEQSAKRMEQRAKRMEQSAKRTGKNDERRPARQIVLAGQMTLMKRWQMTMNDVKPMTHKVHMTLFQ